MALPQYTYDPVTQTYTPVVAPVSAAVDKGAGLYRLFEGDAEASAAGSPPGSAGFIGDLALGLGAYSNLGPLAPGSMIAGFAADALGNIALDQQGRIDAEIGAANLAGVPVATTSSFLSGNAVTTNPQTISGLQGLAAANAAQNAKAVENAQAGMAQTSLAQAVADFADMTDAEAGQAVADAATAAAASASGTTSDGGGSGGDAGGTAGVGSESEHGADGNNSGGGDPDGNGTGEGGGWYKGGQIMNFQGGGYATPRPYIYNQPTMMAEGGLAAAKRTQDAGRGPDTMLVHMAPQEVAGLQALAMAHGGSLTINPKTGLPEAGFLSSLLPTLVGAALTVGSGGAVSPLMAAGLVGGGTALATGSLKKGLFAGLGAFGGGSMGLGLSAAGAPGTVEALAAPASEATMLTPLEVAQTNIDPTLLENMTAEQALNQGMAGSQTAQNAFTAAQNTISASGYPVTSPMDVAQARVLPGTVYPGAPAQPVMPSGIGANFEQAGKGLKNVFQFGPKGSAEQLAGERARSAFSNEAGMGSFSAAIAPLSAVEPEPVNKPVSYVRPYKANVINRSAEMAGQYEPGSTSAREMLSYEFTPQPIYQVAGGGLMDLKAGGTFDDEYGQDEYATGGLTAFAEGKQVKKSKKLGGDPYYKFAEDRKDRSMEAALDTNFAKGGGPRYLNGAGDGMSDDIPAIIDGKQPARLADGEFVIPADVVSHLGNGSSKAGAKKLYSMMDRIRKARTGKKSQAPAVKSERYMPA